MINYERMKQITDEAKFMLAMADLKAVVLELKEKHDKLYVDNELLVKQRDELIDALDGLLSVSLMSVTHDEYASVFDSANNALARAKGAAK